MKRPLANVERGRRQERRRVLGILRHMRVILEQLDSKTHAQALATLCAVRNEVEWP